MNHHEPGLCVRLRPRGGDPGEGVRLREPAVEPGQRIFGPASAYRPSSVVVSLRIERNY